MFSSKKANFIIYVEILPDSKILQDSERFWTKCMTILERVAKPSHVPVILDSVSAATDHYHNLISSSHPF